MNITRYEPWSFINALHRDLDQITSRRYGVAPASEGGSTVADWVPAVDVLEQDEQFLIRADLPGVAPEAIEISMDDGVLSLSGERHHESEDVIDGLKRVERVSGKFYRRFNLPDTANAEAISAKSSNGILEIAIPKQPKVQARRISVEAA